MATYHVKIEVSVLKTIEVEADDIEEAKDKAEAGDGQFIGDGDEETRAFAVEDEHGNRLWEDV